MKYYEQIRHFLSECIAVVRGDLRRVLFNRFPAVADEAALQQHIPLEILYTHLSGDNAASEAHINALRGALSNIAGHVSDAGTRLSIDSFLYTITGSSDGDLRYDLFDTLRSFFLLGFPAHWETQDSIHGILAASALSESELRSEDMERYKLLGNYSGVIVALSDMTLYETVDTYLNVVLPPYVSYEIIERRDREGRNA